MTAGEINHFRKAFPAAVHLAGYGNTLFGCTLEVSDTPREHLDYFPRGERLLFEVRTPDTPESLRGQVAFHRLDRSMFLAEVLERDWAELIPATAQAQKLGWCCNGLRNPVPLPGQTNQLKHGIY